MQELLGGDALDKQLYVEHWCASPPQTFTPMPAGAVALHSLLGDLLCAKKKGASFFAFPGLKKKSRFCMSQGAKSLRGSTRGAGRGGGGEIPPHFRRRPARAT